MIHRALLVGILIPLVTTMSDWFTEESRTSGFDGEFRTADCIKEYIGSEMFSSNNRGLQRCHLHTMEGLSWKMSVLKITHLSYGFPPSVVTHVKYRANLSRTTREKNVYSGPITIVSCASRREDN